MIDQDYKKTSFKARLENRVDINLKPGELHIAKKPAIIKTLLGSCVSVVMHNKRTGISAISHAQLPGTNNCGECSTDCPIQCLQNSPADNRFKYVVQSTKYMLSKLENFGIKRDEIDIKLFGGSNVMKVLTGTYTVGTANVKQAHDTLKSFNLKIKVEDTGGDRGRTIYLVSDSGEVYVRKHTQTARRTMLNAANS